MKVDYFFSEEKDTELMGIFRTFCKLPDEEKGEYLNSLTPEILRDMFILAKRNAERTYFANLLVKYSNIIADCIEAYMIKGEGEAAVMELMRKHKALMKEDRERTRLRTVEEFIEDFTKTESPLTFLSFNIDDISN